MKQHVCHWKEDKGLIKRKQLETKKHFMDTSRGISVLLIKNSKVGTERKCKNPPFLTTETI